MNLFGHIYLWWFQRNHEQRIRRHGWAGVYVGDYHSAPSWAYTVGFDETLDHPELVVFDLPKPEATAMFFQAYDEIRSGALTIEEGVRWPAESRTPGMWRKVHPDQIDEWLTLACLRRYARTGKRYGLEAYQLVLSDGDALPWEEGYDERLHKVQRALWQPMAASAGGLE